MNFIKRNYSLVCLLGALAVGLIVFSLSFRSSKNLLIEQATRTINVVTNVKWRLVDKRLSTLEQQLNLLSKKDQLIALLPPRTRINGPSTASGGLDEYVKSILYSQGSTRVWLFSQSGEVQYKSNPDLTDVPAEVLRFVQAPADAQNPTSISVVLSEKDPFPFYLSKRIIDTKGILLGTLCMEVPREFLSAELHNTISMDSLHSYLVSPQGVLDQQGRINPDTCTACKWGGGNYIQFAPRERVRDTWKVLTVFPISQIDIQHIAYVSLLDGLIAFFMATGVAMVIIYTLQAIQKSKGITHADIMLVQTTWNAVSEYSIKIISGFYMHLFADAPEIEPMFKSARDEQEKRMALMINTIVNSADSLEEFKGSIAQLAKRHVHMGVKREYFPVVVKAIINSVADQYGSGFTPAHKKSWYKILNQVSAIMIAEMESYQQTMRNKQGAQNPLPG